MRRQPSRLGTAVAALAGLMLMAVLPADPGFAGAPASRSDQSIEIGAVYPTGGPQGPGGREEFRGAELAAQYVNDRGGVRGRSLRLRLISADSPAAAPGAVERLAGSGSTIVMGSYGSTISRPAAEAASRLGIVFWETGAVGQLGMAAGSGRRVFRFSPAGATLGRAAVVFVRDHLIPRLRRDRQSLPRYGVVYVDDAYGRAVGIGALDEIATAGLPLAGAFPYDLARVDYNDLADRIARARTDILIVAAYLQDGVALRWALVGRRVPLLASIGTSSSYCMPLFGQILGEHAVGLFASDKPDGDILHPDRLAPEAAHALRWARDEYRRRYGEAMSSAALSGFAGAMALFRHVLPAARDLSPDEVARAARSVILPRGSLPDGSGLAFAPTDGGDASANLRATHVIWEWIRPKTRAVVWPPSFATHSIVFP